MQVVVPSTDRERDLTSYSSIYAGSNCLRIHDLGNRSGADAPVHQGSEDDGATTGSATHARVREFSEDLDASLWCSYRLVYGIGDWRWPDGKGGAMAPADCRQLIGVSTGELRVVIRDYDGGHSRDFHIREGNAAEDRRS